MNNREYKIVAHARQFTGCILAIISLVVGFKAIAQTANSTCMKVSIMLYAHNEPINNKTIKRSDLSHINSNISYYNCGNADINYYSRPDLNNNYLTYKNINDPYEHPIYIRIYKRTGKEYSLFNYDKPGDCMIVEDPLDDYVRILQPNKEFISHQACYYFEALPPGEYNIYFDYISIYGNNSKSRNTHDSTMVKKCNCGYSCYTITDGYFFQTSPGSKVHFTVIK